MEMLGIGFAVAVSIGLTGIAVVSIASIVRGE